MSLLEQPVSNSAPNTNSPRPSNRSHFELTFTSRYQPMVNLATQLVDERPIAEEIVQEAFQKLWQRWAELDEPSSYLRAIVVNHCHDELRRRRVRREKWRHEQRPVVIEDTHDGQIDYLGDVLSTVCPRRRRALVLRYYGGHSVAEVAEAMRIPTGTAKSLIHRGLADLRVALN